MFFKAFLLTVSFDYAWKFHHWTLKKP